MTNNDPELFPSPPPARTWGEFLKGGKLGAWSRKPDKGKASKETQLNKSIRAMLERLGAWCWRCNSGKLYIERKGRGYWVHLAPTGTPDTIGEYGGRALAVEGKVDAAVSPEQAAWGRRAIERGWLYAIVRPATMEQLALLLQTGVVQKETLDELDRVG